MDVDEKPLDDADSNSKNSYYISGLWIYGAKWDPNERTLQDLPRSETTTEK